MMRFSLRLLAFGSALTVSTYAELPPAPGENAPSSPSAAVPAQARLVDDRRFAELQADPNIASADTALELGLAYDERHESAQAATCYRRAAAANVAVAELRLGALYETGEGVPQSYVEARAHYQRAIDLGLAEANLRLGLLEMEGWGGPVNSTSAVLHIRIAAEAGYQPAQQILSDMFYAGVHVPKNLGLALKWAERAAANSDPDVQTQVGKLHQAARKRPSDVALAREWYQLSAEQDHTRGMLAMAESFLHPGSSADDLRLCQRWLQLAADGGNAAAKFYLAGLILVAPVEYSGDRTEGALKLFHEASEGGEYEAFEVLEFAKGNRTLAEAFIYTTTTPAAERHIQRVAADPRFAEDAQGNRRPRPIKLVWPVYPQALRLLEIEGEALIEFTVDTTGRPRDAKIVSATHPAFGESALRSILAARYLPAKRNGQFVDSRRQQPVKFVLTDTVDDEFLGRPKRATPAR